MMTALYAARYAAGITARRCRRRLHSAAAIFSAPLLIAMLPPPLLPPCRLRHAPLMTVFAACGEYAKARAPA